MNQGHLITFQLDLDRAYCVLCVTNSEQTPVILKRFKAPGEVRVLDKGRFEVVHFGGMSVTWPY